MKYHRLILSVVLALITGLAVPPAQADMLVSSFSTNRILRYDEMTGAFLGDFIAPGSGGLGTSTGLTFGPDRHLYVANVEAHSILRYHGTTGAFLDAFVPAGSGGLQRPHGVVFGLDGNLYISSAETRSVLRYHGTTGAFLDAFVPTGSGGLQRPTGMVFGPDGNLYVNSFENSSVLRYHGTTGAPLPAPGQAGAFFVPPGSGGLAIPIMGLTFGPDGNLYVGGHASDNVLRYDGTTGTFLGAFVPVGSGGLNGTHDLVFRPDGNLYVVSEVTNSILRYDATTGAFLGAFVPSGSGGLDRPVSLAFTPQQVVPEPAGLTLLGIGALGLLGYVWRRHKRGK